MPINYYKEKIVTFLKPFINNAVNPLLYYVDNGGFSVFKNFCLFKNNGNKYNKIIPVKDAGQILEYRMKLNKKIRLFTIFITIFLYLIFIHLLYSFKGLLLCEILWIISYFSARIKCSELYKQRLLKTFGQYEVTDFEPHISLKKQKEYLKTYLWKISFIAALLCIFLSFSSVLQGLIRYNVNKPKPNYNNAEIISGIYTKIYPEIPMIYEIRAQEDYISGDFENAEKNYIKALDMYDKKFREKDYTRFANLLYIARKSSGSQNAIDLFNEYTTKKKTDIQQQIKLLWIKSMFSISSGLPDFVENDYDDLLTSVSDNKNKKYEFYIMSDKAYMLYLMRNYKGALNIYDVLIPYAKDDKDKFAQDIPRLLAERGFTKKQIKDNTGANSDFLESKIDLYEIKKYEPKINEPSFIVPKY